MSHGEVMELDVHNEKGEVVGSVRIDDALLKEGVRYRLLAEVVRMYEARRRGGTRSTKTRGERRGGGRKPWRQKGTGHARHGSRRSPIWRKGGVVFGPRPKDYAYSLPRKALKRALRSALCGKLLDQEMKIVEDVKYDEPKTSRAATMLSALGLSDGKVLFVLPEPDANIYKSFRNIPNVSTLPLAQLNAYEVLRGGRILMARSAVERVADVVKLK